MTRLPDTLPVETPTGDPVFQRFVVRVVSGDSAGAEVTSASRTITLGSHQANDLVVDDPTVSRFHCEVVAAGARLRVRDLGSKNGTRVGGVYIHEASVVPGTELLCGHTRLKLVASGEQGEIAVASTPSFGPLIGNSPAMREAFAVLERAAGTTSTVLVEGETGTGKEGAAEGLHTTSTRADGPLVVINCGAIAPTLVESELFGHERGAFTGADSRRIGAFEEAHGGTLFLDEIGELSLDIQPKLLRALENRQIRRIGGNQQISCDVRVVAATNRDLRAEVNDGRFRADLYYRLAVIRIQLPPLRARSGDLLLLVEHLARQLGASDTELRLLTADDFIEQLTRARWPGNVRELRNHVERCLVMHEATAPTSSLSPSGDAVGTTDPSIPYDEARRRSIEAFERSYAAALLAMESGNVARAAKHAGMNRAYLYRLLKRHGIKPR